MRGALAALLLALPGSVAADGFAVLEGHGGPVMGIAVDDRTGIVATASFDNSVGLWTGDAPRWLDGHDAAVNRVAFLPSGQVVSASDDFRVLQWPPEGSPKTILTHKGKVMDLAVAPDGRIASASWDGTIGLSDPQPRFLKGHDGPVNAVVFAKNGTRLYSGSADGTLRAWDTATGTELRQLVQNGFGINTLALPPDEDWLAYGTVDGVVKVIDPVTTDQIADFTLDRRPILAMDHDSVLGQLAVGDGDGYIMVIDTATWTIARDFHATLKGPIWALAFSPGGTDIYAGGLDFALHRWPVASLDDQPPIADTGQSFLRDPAQMDNGERQFARKCSICHSLTPGTDRRAGPTLHKLFGRPAGSIAGYTYSEALTGTNLIWTEATIDALFDIGPEHYLPGTKMPMQRITGTGDRKDLIAFLKRATQP